MAIKTCYVMVRDVESQEDDCALEWGVEFDLEDGEELPEDLEELTNAQFTVFQFIQMLNGVYEDAGAEIIMGDAPSHLIVPKSDMG